MNFRKLSAEEMDRALTEAANVLRQLPFEAVHRVATWWDQWYRIAGHRRLGRQLLNYSTLRTGPQAVNNTQHEVSPLRASTSSTGLIYSFTEEELDSPDMFSIRSKGGEISIVINSAHPCYVYLKDTIESPLLEAPTSGDIANARLGLRVLLEGWAGLELSQPPGLLQLRIQEARTDWSRLSRQIVSPVD